MVHVPMDHVRRKARGFAFVNFETHKAAAHCMVRFQGFHEWGVPSHKVCKTEWSDRQGGLAEQLLLARSAKRTDVSGFGEPAIFHRGVRTMLPLI